MVTLPHHINCFELQYDKALTRHRLFGAYIVVRIHKRFQVFLHFFITTSLQDMETRALTYFGKLQGRAERGEWITTAPHLVGYAGAEEHWEKKII